MLHSRFWFALVLVVACGDDDSVTDASADTSSGDTNEGFDAPDLGPPNSAPTAVITGTSGGAIPLTLTLDGSESTDPDGDPLTYEWHLGDASGTSETFEAMLADAGCVMVSLTVSDPDGASDTAEMMLGAFDDGSEPMVTLERALPAPSALVPRDVATDRATIEVGGTTTGAIGRSITLSATRGDESFASSVLACGDDFTLALDLPSSLEPYAIQVALADADEPIASVADVLVGDVIIVQGQSNAVSSMFVGSADEDERPYVRSFGIHNLSAADASEQTWRVARGDEGTGPAAIGQWAVRMGSQLAEQTGVPLAILNGAIGGQPIAHFTRNDADPLDTTTNYGRLLLRAQNAGVAGNVRAILFYQGESDNDDDATHVAGFTALHADWQEDYPSTEKFYVTQIHTGCGRPTPRFLQAQVDMALALENTAPMSVTGLGGHDGCHYAYADGYQRLGDDYARRLLRDLYGMDMDDVEPPRATSAVVEDGMLVITLTGDFTELTIDERFLSMLQTTPPAATLSEPTIEGDTLRLSVTGALTRVGFPAQPAGMPHPTIRNAAGLGLLGFELAVE